MDDGSGQLGFQNIGERMLNCPSSGLNNALSEKVAGMATSSTAMFKSPHGGEPPYGSDWGPIVSMSHSENFGGSSMASYGGFANPSNPILLENRGMSNRSHLVHYPADPNLTEMSPKLSVFGSGNFSEMINSFCLTGYGQTSDAIGPPNYASNKSGGIDNDSVDAAQAHGDFHITEERVVGASPNGKRKASDPSSLLEPNENAEGDSEKDLSGETSEQKEVFEKKQKMKQNSGAKQKEAKDDPKANYIHVRARRGQATNSHSLAERVRREKISERMRLLQELVPGCNKITGKAVMLDEIINYVQSLQQQVEFLSMKLATVNPELNFAIDQILSKDILHARGGGTSIVGFNSGMSSIHPYSQGFHLGGVLGVSNTTSQYHPIPQAIWDSDLQTVLHTGFDSNPTVGSSETEL